MKKYYLFLLTFFMVAVSAGAEVTVCGNAPDGNGNFSCQYIKRGTINWNNDTKTLTLDNAVIEYSSDTPYDYVYPINITEDATIIIHGECKLTSTGFIALAFWSYNAKTITIKGDGSLYTSSRWIDIFIKATNLTIKDIYVETNNGIADNGEGYWVGLTFDNVSAFIKGLVERIGLGITFMNCAITYPSDAFIAHDYGDNYDFGYYISCSSDRYPDHIVISRSSNIKGDVNNDGEVNIADVNTIIDAILSGSNNLNCDVNADKEINIADVNELIDIILGGGAPAPDNHEYVDLGLPSGTLWATCNVGANSPEEYGDYFAWGETARKVVYDWNTYKWCNGSEYTITKYCANSTYGYNGFTDDKTELEPVDDAAYVNWGALWRMPTKAQQDELREKCTWTWSTRNGVKGCLVIGPNNNSIFLPAAGGRYNSSPFDVNTWGYYWSRSLYLDNSRIVYNLSCNREGADWNCGYRNYGFSVRAVRASQN
jgi:hypothetical protein